MCANCCTQNSSLHRCLVHLATDSMTLTRASVDSARMKWTVRPLRKQANADLCCRPGSCGYSSVPAPMEVWSLMMRVRAEYPLKHLAILKRQPGAQAAGFTVRPRYYCY